MGDASMTLYRVLEFQVENDSINGLINRLSTIPVNFMEQDVRCSQCGCTLASDPGNSFALNIGESPSSKFHRVINNLNQKQLFYPIFVPRLLTMSSVFSLVFSLAPYHLLSYGTLLGTELYQVRTLQWQTHSSHRTSSSSFRDPTNASTSQSFIMTKICFQALPMPQFTTLQKRVFPIYFKLQTGLSVLVAITHPPMSLRSMSKSRQDYVPLAVALGVSMLNLVVYGPRTQRVMVERTHQGKQPQLGYCLPRSQCAHSMLQEDDDVLLSANLIMI